jgi:hypothetical protein
MRTSGRWCWVCRVCAPRDVSKQESGPGQPGCFGFISRCCCEPTRAFCFLQGRDVLGYVSAYASQVIYLGNYFSPYWLLMFFALFISWGDAWTDALSRVLVAASFEASVLAQMQASKSFQDYIQTQLRAQVCDTFAQELFYLC